MKVYDLIIIGAGASGLFFASQTKESKRKILILESNLTPGRKLLATGNGRCNFSNISIGLTNFYSENEDFFRPTIEKISSDTVVESFESMGMATTQLSKGRLYPRSLEARSVLDILLMEAERYGVEISYNRKVMSAQKIGQEFLVYTEDEFFKSKALVLACGGTTLKKSGSDGSGYDIARSLGHRITQLGPGIVQIKLKGSTFKKMEGVRFEAGLSLYDENSFIGKDIDEVLFTSYGISGPASLQLSRRALDVLRHGSRAFFHLDLFPEDNYNDLLSKLAYKFSLEGWKTLEMGLVSILPRKLIGPLLEGDFSKEISLGEFPYKDLERLVRKMKDWVFEVDGFYTMDSAQVTRGGVDTLEINKETMESKIHDSLYIIGELLDVDGDCGGYNLHWAWASAQVAANTWRKKSV